MMESVRTFGTRKERSAALSFYPLLVLTLLSAVLLGIGCGASEESARPESTARDMAPDAVEAPTPAASAESTAPAASEAAHDHGEAVEDAAASYENAGEVVAHINDMEITRRMLAWYVGENERKGFTQKEVFTKSLEDLKPLVTDVAVTLEGARLTDEQDILTTDTKKYIERMEKAMLVSILGSQVVDQRIPPPTDELLREFYSENTASFTIPFHFSAYLIYISNYVAVKAGTNETLEDIARRISGDVQQVENILTDTPEKAPRAPDYFSGNRDAIAPLEEGERLLVPVSKEQKEMNYQRALDAKKRIDEGEDFLAVSLEVSDSSTQGELIENIGLSGRPPSEAVMEAARATPEGEISNVFETKHGYNLLHVAEKHPESVQPFEEVRDQVEEKWRGKTRAKLSTDFLDELLKSKPELSINYERLGDPSTPDDAVVAQIGEQRYLKSDLVTEGFGQSGELVPREALVEALKANMQFVRDIIANEARKRGIDKTPQFIMSHAGLYGISKTDKYMTREMGDYKPEDLPLDEVRQYFEENKESFRLAPTYSYHVFGLKLGDDKIEKDVVERMSKLLQNVKSRDAFVTVVDRYSEDPAKHYKSGLLEDVPEPQIHDALRGPIKTLEEGTRTEPIVADDYVISVFLVERKPARLPEFEEVEKDVRRALSEKKKRELPPKIADRLLENVKIEYAF